MMDTTATVKDGMLTIKADEDIIDFIKENINKVFTAFTEAEHINPLQIIEKLENDREYLQYFLDHVELAYAYIGLHEMLSSL